MVIAGVFGALWALLVWIVVGGIAGAIADRLIQGDKLGIVGNIVIGIVGGFVGGSILGLFGFDNSGIFWTFITSLLGACLLLWIISYFTKGRGVGSKRL